MASTNAASTSERLDWPTLAVGAIFFLVAASLGGVGLWKLYAETRGIGESERARAEVLRKAIHADRTQGAAVRPRHRVEYRFAPPMGEPVSASADVGPELWARLEPGAPIEVAYLPADPATHRVEGEERDLTVWMVFALVGAVFGPLGAWLARNGLPRTPGSRGEARMAAWFSRAPVLAFGIIGVLFFLPFFAGGVFWLGTIRSTQELFELRGQPVEGTVLSKAIVRKQSGTSRGHSRSHSTHYQVVYRFQADGADVVGTSELDSDDWELLRERGPIAVVYVGGSPWLHRVAGDSAGWIAPILFLTVGGLGMLGSAAAAWFWGRGSRPRARKAPIVPPATQPASPKVRRARGWLWGAGFGAVFFFAGCGALVEGVLDFVAERRYASEGRLADARVVGKDIAHAERGGRRRTEYVARYRFETADGRPAEGHATLEVGAWEAAKPGDRIRVRYLPQEPRTNRPAAEGGVAVAIIFMIIGPLFALIGAFIAWGSWLSRNDA